MQGRISPIQLFMLIVSFELGSAIIFGIGAEAKQDAWLVVMLATFAGILLYFMYTQLYLYYPTEPLTQYIPKLLGKPLGYPISMLYVIYFIYIGARVFRDFMELILSTILVETPLAVVSLLSIVLICYAVYQGIEVIGRTSEFMLPLVLFMSLLGTFLFAASNLINLDNLRPILAEGIMPVLSATVPSGITFPFGEMVLFGMFLPFLNEKSKARPVGYLALLVSGFILTYTMAANIAVLGANEFARSSFPLLSTIRLVSLGRFIERLDVIGITLMTIGGFFKISLFFSGAVIGVSSLFPKIPERNLVIPVGMIIFATSIVIAKSYTEHIEEGLKVVPLYLHVPFQLIMPFILLIIAFFKNRAKG